MSTGAVPPLPQGYTLDSAAPPLPSGYTLDQPADAAPATAPTGFLANAWDELKGQAKGLGSYIASGGPMNPANAVNQAVGVVNNYQRRTDEGRALPYKLLTAGTEIAGIPTGAQGEEEAAARGDVTGVLGHAAVPIAETIAGAAAPEVAKSVAEKAAPLRAAAAKTVVGPLVKQPLGMTQANIAHGIDPAAAITNEGLVAGSRGGLVDQIQQRVSDLHQATDNVLQNHPNATMPLDAGPVIDQAVADHVDAAEKVGNDALAARLQKVGDALKTKHGPIQGTPYEINTLKRSVGESASDLGAFKSADPVEAGVASMMGDVYSGLKNMVNEAVPEAVPLNQRSANLLGARTAVNRSIALDTNRSMFSGLSLTNALPRLVEATVGSTPARTAAASLLRPGEALSVPTEGIYGTPQRIPPITGTQQQLPSVNGPLFEMRQTPTPVQRPAPLARIPGRNYDVTLGEQAPGGPQTAPRVIQLPAGETPTPVPESVPAYRGARPEGLNPQAQRYSDPWATPGEIYSGSEPPQSEFAYRSRDVGEKGVPTTGNRPQATTDADEARSYAEPGAGREQVTGKPQQVIRYDLSKLKEGVDYERVPRPGKPDWIRMLRPLREGEVEAAD